MPTFPFPTDPQMMAITIAFRNKRLIADDILPRIKVGKMEFRYTEHALEEGFSIPETMVGRKSAPNEVSFEAVEKTGVTKDYALDDPIPNVDIENAPKGHNPRDYSTETITNLIMLDREIRVAAKVYDAANYPVANKIALAGTSQWNDYVNSDPIGNITTAIEAMIFRPNVMSIGRRPFSILRRHPDIIASVKGSAVGKGIARNEEIADLFELEKLLVGEAFVNNARKGQAASMQRVWGNHASLHYIDENIQTPDGAMPSFGFTAQYGDRLAGSEQDSKIGMRGGERVRVGESVEEIIASGELGYFIENAVAP